MFVDELKNLQMELIAHPIYNAVETMDDLHRFMRVHVFAVWDFMSLAKRLQNFLTCVQVPWIPPEDEASARLINDIVLNEESDVDRDGSPASHLTLYLKGMREVGAPTRMFDTFLCCLKQGDGIDESLEAACVPRYAREFVHSNLTLAQRGSREEVAGNFLFGREDSIPKMFRKLLATRGIPAEEAPGMVYYLERHIELDSEQHGPAAINILKRMIGDDHDRYTKALESARQAIRARIRLWDGILSDIRSAAEPG
ncbi:DUF3050 domain-containing protein [Candidatus Thiosymbion oneisti]|uniref:DUF3050 domain-containing protein n=1 Tax=Candidatus Thiosymbion oneisti TaxID=589554 RepID=UPI000A8A81DD|nr:DUF3050 domain-containing protein [Candidatus Thiosymbion oneisti]